MSVIVGFAVTVAIWPREVVSCHNFILRAVATFWAMSLVGIYPGRASGRRGTNSDHASRHGCQRNPNKSKQIRTAFSCSFICCIFTMFEINFTIFFFITLHTVFVLGKGKWLSKNGWKWLKGLAMSWYLLSF